MTCSKCNCLSIRKCGVALVLQDLNQNGVDVASSLVSPNCSDATFPLLPDTADGLTPVVENQLRDVDKDDVHSDNDSERDETNPAVQNQTVLAGVKNKGPQDITEIVWSEV